MKWVCSYPLFSSGKKGCSCEGFSACPAGASAWHPGAAALMSPVYNSAEELVRTRQWARTDGEAAKAWGYPEFMFFPSQHCSRCLCFPGVRLAPPTGPSAMRIPWSLLVFLSLVWSKAVPIFSESELWTRLVSACHPGCQSLWLLWILQTEPGLEVRCAFYRLHGRFEKSQLIKKK